MARKSKGGTGLLGIVAVAGLLTFTNAGDWLLTRLQGLSSNCSMAMPREVGVTGSKICGGVSWAVNGTTELAEKVGKFFHGASELKDKVASAIPTVGDRKAVASSIEGAVASLSSPGDRLNQMMRSGPQALSSSNVSQQFQQAIDSFTIGQHLMRDSNGSQAQAWFQQGAQQPNGFGMLSQLSLGDMYRFGNGGVAQNPLQAEAYYRQALQSLTQLNAGNTPQAQQMVKTLPASVPEIQQQIVAIIRELRQGR